MDKTEVIGLDYFGARYFSGAQGRFTSPDWSEKPTPIPYADLSNPQSLNLYSYALNNPLRGPDPMGHDCPKCKVQYDGETKVGGDKNWRNNNPGNIRMGKFARAHGATRADKDGFAIFDSMAAGSAAQGALWKTKSYQDLTVSDAIGKYAPKSENDTEGYIKNVSDAVGVKPDVKVSDLSDEQLADLLAQQKTIEGTKEGKVVPAEPKPVPTPTPKKEEEPEQK
jgi:RHS repeat-associated protein